MSRIQELMTYPDLRVSIGSSSAVETEREIPQSPSSCSTLVRGNTEGAIVSGVCHGTLGELIQGPYLQGGELHISLISLPIKQYSVVHFVCGEDGDIDVDLRGKDKCRKAIDLYLARYQQPLPHGRWMCDSELLVGKGMASSTADIVATIRCLDRLFNAQSSPNVIAGILRELERSDSVFLDTYALYLSGKQEIVQPFEGDPQFYACYIDEGNSVDTDKVGASLLANYERHLSEYQANLERIVTAFRKRDWQEIARCATTSARLSQNAVPKHKLEVLLSQQQRYGADGIVVAHTGSLLGYLFIRKPSVTEMGELSAFFRGLGYPCRFVQTGF